MIWTIKIRKYERGFLFRDGEFYKVLRPGRHWVLDPLFRASARVVSVRDIWLPSTDLELIVRSGMLGD